MMPLAQMLLKSNKLAQLAGYIAAIIHDVDHQVRQDASLEKADFNKCHCKHRHDVHCGKLDCSSISQL